MIADCGYLDNIAYDYERGRLTPEYEIKGMCNSLTFSEQARLMKHYTKAREAGSGSSEHFKLVVVACDIIKNNLPAYIRNTICPSPLHSSRKYMGVIV